MHDFRRENDLEMYHFPNGKNGPCAGRQKGRREARLARVVAPGSTWTDRGSDPTQCPTHEYSSADSGTQTYSVFVVMADASARNGLRPDVNPACSERTELHGAQFHKGH